MLFEDSNNSSNISHTCSHFITKGNHSLTDKEKAIIKSVSFLEVVNPRENPYIFVKETSKLVKGECIKNLPAFDIKDFHDFFKWFNQLEVEFYKK